MSIKQFQKTLKSSMPEQSCDFVTLPHLYKHLHKTSVLPDIWLGTHLKWVALPGSCPFWGWFIIGTLALLRVSLYTKKNKFEVSDFIRYEDMNGDVKCKKWGGLGRLGVTHGHRHGHHRSTERIYDLLFKIDRNCGYILPKSSRPTASHFCHKSPIFTHPTCIWRHRLA